MFASSDFDREKRPSKSIWQAKMQNRASFSDCFSFFLSCHVSLLFALICGRGGGTNKALTRVAQESLQGSSHLFLSNARTDVPGARPVVGLALIEPARCLEVSCVEFSRLEGTKRGLSLQPPFRV